MTECCIYYTQKEEGDENEEEEYKSPTPGNFQLCPYEFHLRTTWTSDRKKINSAVDTSQQDSVRILYQDVIFEDWVHDLNGFIIPNKEIQKHLD